jgi:hypothetical protein
MPERDAYYTKKFNQEEMIASCKTYERPKIKNIEHNLTVYSFYKNPPKHDKTRYNTPANKFFNDDTSNLYYHQRDHQIDHQIDDPTYIIYVSKYGDGHIIVAFKNGKFPYFFKEHLIKWRVNDVDELKEFIDYLDYQFDENSQYTADNFYELITDVKITLHQNVKLNFKEAIFDRYDEKLHGHLRENGTYWFDEGKYNQCMADKYGLILTDKSHGKTKNIEVSDLWDRHNGIHYHVKRKKSDLRILALQIWNSIRYLSDELHHENKFVVDNGLAITLENHPTYVAVIILKDDKDSIKGCKDIWAMELIQNICEGYNIPFEIHLIRYNNA